MRPAVHVDDAPRMWTGDVEDVDLLLLGHVHDFESGGVEEPRARRRLTPDQRWIQIVLGVARLRERARPRLQRDVRRAGESAKTRPYFPVPFVFRRRTEVHMAIRKSRRRRRSLRERRRSENPKNPENP